MGHGVPPPPVRIGDRICLSGRQTGLGEPVWASVDLVDYIPHPSDEPWNSGPVYPWRIGYRITVIDSEADIREQFGIIWVDHAGRDASSRIDG